MASDAGAASDRDGPILPPEIGHALACQPFGMAASAGEAIQLGLAARMAADGPQAFGGSRLTGDGFPVEFAVSSADDRVRITMEPGGRKLAPPSRLELALSTMARIDSRPVDGAALATIRWLQATAQLGYGAWIGCRVDAAGRRDAKLYAELPASPVPAMMTHFMPALGDRPVVARMLGCASGGRGLELYLRLPSLLPAELPALLDPVGFVDESGPLLDFLARIHGHALRGRLPGESVGVSYAAGPAGSTVTLFFTARALWGADASIRRSFSALIPAGRARDAYLAATAAATVRTEWRTYHGLVGITPRRGAEPQLVLGYRPMALP